MSAHRLDRTILRVTGPDARPFLDNLITQDLGKLSAAPCLYGGLLSPQGKVLADFLIWPEATGGVWLEADPARGPDLLRRLNMFKLRAAVTIEDVSGEMAALAGETPGGHPADPRLPALGWRALVPAADAANAAPDPERYRSRRIVAGVPDLVEDCGPEEVFALEALFEELNGVDFRKGCFVGQENVSRMKRRATTRKKFCRLTFEGAAPTSGAPITAGAAELGTVRSVAGAFALGLLRLDRALEALNQGQDLQAGEANMRLDPPDWLIMPEGG